MSVEVTPLSQELLLGKSIIVPVPKIPGIEIILTGLETTWQDSTNVALVWPCTSASVTFLEVCVVKSLLLKLYRPIGGV